MFKMVTTFPTLEPSPCWLGDGHTKIYISSSLAKVMGVKVKSQKYKKWSKCTKFPGRFKGRLIFWPATLRKNRQNPGNMTLLAWFAICILAILAKVIGDQCTGKNCTLRRFLVKCAPGGDIFFWHFCLLAPDSLCSAGNNEKVSHSMVIPKKRKIDKPSPKFLNSKKRKSIFSLRAFTKMS